MSGDVTATVSTDAGMWLLWRPEAFASVRDYDSWSEELEDDEDISRHVREGDCVPITIGQDMAAAFVVRVARSGVLLRKAVAASLTQRESDYLFLSSEPYLLVSNGSAVLTSIEGVVGGRDQTQVVLPAGRWSVTVHLVEWDQEPGALVDGKPGPNALPDFVVLVEQARPEQEFRQSLEAFVRP